MEINLGDAKKARVSLNGESYDIRLPRIYEARELQKALKKENADEIEIFSALVEKLGMPKKALEKLDMYQFKSFVDGLLDFSKKN